MHKAYVIGKVVRGRIVDLFVSSTSADDITCSGDECFVAYGPPFVGTTFDECHLTAMWLAGVLRGFYCEAGLL